MSKDHPWGEPINLGTNGFRIVHEKSSGLIFSEEGRAVRHAKEDLGIAPDEIRIDYIDTRPTYKELHKIIIKKERDFCRGKKGYEDDQQKYSVGPWDEYFDLVMDFGTTAKIKDKIDTNGRFVCHVQRGTNEGYYIHISFVTMHGEEIRFIVGKTCNGSCSEEQYLKRWESAARISYWLMEG